MPAHHQHRHGQARLVVFLERFFDVVHGFAQGTEQSGFFGKAEALLGRAHFGELVAVSFDPRFGGGDRAA